MRALVTGAAGFIGSSLTDALLAQGFEVVGVDALLPNYEIKRKRENVGRASAHPRFRLVEVDLRHASWEPLLEGVSHVAHLAALPGVHASWGGAFGDYVAHNVLVTQRMLEALRHTDVRRVVVASSSSVYGTALRIPTTEEEPRRPVSPYGVTKLATEALVHAYREGHDVPALALRYFTVYGPRQRPDMAIHRFFEAARRGEPVPVYGDGNQTRDFTFIDDAVQGTLAALTSPRAGIVYNIGGGHRVTVNEVLDRIERIAGRAVPRRATAARPGDPSDTGSDAALARRDLGFEPKTDLAEGLTRQWEWQRSLN